MNDRPISGNPSKRAFVRNMDNQGNPVSRLADLMNNRRKSNLDVIDPSRRRSPSITPLTDVEKKHEQSALLAKQFYAQMNLVSLTNNNPQIATCLANTIQASSDERIRKIKKPGV